jgi:hypothetical protein
MMKTTVPFFVLWLELLVLFFKRVISATGL